MQLVEDGLTLGLAQRPALRERARDALPGWVVDGAVLAPRVLTRLALGAAMVTAFCLVCSLPTAANLVGTGGGLSGGLALVVVSVAYLPNVIIGALSVSIGPGAILGQTTVTAFGAVHAPLPAVPVLAVVPHGSGSWWWLAVLLVPAVVNAATAYRDAWTRSQRVIRERLLPVARDQKIIIAVEEVWNKFLQSPLEFARYVDESE